MNGIIFSHDLDNQPDALDDFRVRNLTEISQALASTSGVMTNLLLIVALISLVVGGVGIMNIMLVSVTERTREIGIRMAVGARTGDILRQFLIEAVVLCLAGGIAGILLGRGVSVAVTLPSLADHAIGARRHCRGRGIGDGWHHLWFLPRVEGLPLDPIDALRYE